MTEEEKKAAEEAKKKADADAADKAKADADGGEKLDKILSHLDSMGKRMDAMEGREKERCDAEEAKADKARKDAEEEERKKATPEQLAADRAKKDAEEVEAKKKADAEEAEKKKADADARRDADIKKIADAVANTPKSMMDADYGSMADAQARADGVYQAFGNRAPPPLQGETPHAYRIRLVKAMQKHSAPWKEIDLSALPDNALGVAEGTIYADAVKASSSHEGVELGKLREVTRTTPSGHRETVFYGPQTFFTQLKPLARKATRLGLRKDA